jgi:hypothetical protein
MRAFLWFLQLAVVAALAVLGSVSILSPMRILTPLRKLYAGRNYPFSYLIYKSWYPIWIRFGGVLMWLFALVGTFALFHGL